MTDHLEIARGYYELGMVDEAFEELEAMGKDARDVMEVIRLKVELLIHGKRWPEALAMSQRLCENEPHGVQGYIHAAFCLHEMGRTRDACDLLRAVPRHVQEEPIWLYNLGCYHAVLGENEDACEFLERSFKLDGSLRETAKGDPDLAGVLGELG